MRQVTAGAVVLAWKKPQSLQAEPSFDVSDADDSGSRSLAMSTTGSSWGSSSPTTALARCSLVRMYFSGISPESEVKASSVIPSLWTILLLAASIVPLLLQEIIAKAFTLCSITINLKKRNRSYALQCLCLVTASYI